MLGVALAGRVWRVWSRWEDVVGEAGVKRVQVKPLCLPDVDGLCTARERMLLSSDRGTRMSMRGKHTRRGGVVSLSRPHQRRSHPVSNTPMRPRPLMSGPSGWRRGGLHM